MQEVFTLTLILIISFYIDTVSISFLIIKWLKTLKKQIISNHQTTYIKK